MPPTTRSSPPAPPSSSRTRPHQGDRLGAKVKTDKIDARILAHLLRADLIPEAWAPPQDVRELRDLVRLRWRFVAQRTTAKNRISNLLARECLRSPARDLFGRARPRLARRARARPPTRRTLVELLLATIAEADAHVAALTALLHERLDGAAEVQLLTTIPGVGFITAATLVAELGDWRRFGSAKQVSAYFGIVPSRARLGGGGALRAHHPRRLAVTRAAPGRGRARGRAPARARCALATCRSRRRRGKKVALVAAARELLELSWTLLSRGEVYRAAA